MSRLDTTRAFLSTIDLDPTVLFDALALIRRERPRFFDEVADYRDTLNAERSPTALKFPSFGEYARLQVSIWNNGLRKERRGAEPVSSGYRIAFKFYNTAKRDLKRPDEQFEVTMFTVSEFAKLIQWRAGKKPTKTWNDEVAAGAGELLKTARTNSFTHVGVPNFLSGSRAANRGKPYVANHGVLMDFMDGKPLLCIYQPEGALVLKGSALSQEDAKGFALRDRLEWEARLSDNHAAWSTAKLSSHQNAIDQ